MNHLKSSRSHRNFGKINSDATEDKTTQNVSTGDANGDKNNTETTNIEDKEVKEFELKAINSSVKRWLVLQKYKLAAITFTEEAGDRSFIPYDEEDEMEGFIDEDELPPLLSLYRLYYNGSLALSNLKGYSNFTLADKKKMQKEITSLKSNLEKLKTVNTELSQRLESAQLSNSLLQQKQKELLQVQQELEENAAHYKHGVVKAEAEQTQEIKEDKSEENQKSEGNGNGSSSTTPKLEKGPKRRILAFKVPEVEETITKTDSSNSLAERDQVEDQIDVLVALRGQDSSAVKIVAKCLPNIVPTVLLNARDKLIPILLCIIWQHPKPEVRDQLTRILFNLIKKPDEQQRKTIMRGCVTLAKLIGHERSEVELLPQCWEQITNKYEERRVLVAESCGALVGHVGDALRGSLLLSILNQLQADPSPLVRSAVAANLGLVITYYTSNDKYGMIEEMFLRFMCDKSEAVVHSCKNILLPFLTQWSISLDCLCSRLVPLLLEEVGKLLKTMDPDSINKYDANRLTLMVECLSSTFPQVWEIVVVSSPFDHDNFTVISSSSDNEMELCNSMKAFFYSGITEQAPETSVHYLVEDKGEQEETNAESNETEELTSASLQNESLAGPIARSKGIISTLEQRQSLMLQILRFFQQEGQEEWEKLQWFKDKFLCTLIQMMMNSKALASPIVMQRMIKLLQKICSTIGEEITKKYIRPMFAMHIDGEMPSALAAQQGRIRLLPVYLAGVLGTTFATATANAANSASAAAATAASKRPSSATSLLLQSLRDVIVNIGLEEYGWTISSEFVLHNCIKMICTTTKKQEELVSLLSRDMVVHPAIQVRKLLLSLYTTLIDILPSEELEKYILPAVITLSNDVDTSVRVASIKPLADFAGCVTQSSVLEKISVQFDTILESGTFEMKCEVVRSLTSIILNVNSKFRDAFILPKLVRITANNRKRANLTQRKQMAILIFDAYRALDGCSIERETLVKYIIPGLKLLQADTTVLEAQRTKLNSNIRDLQNAIAASSKPAQRSNNANKSTSANNNSSATASPTAASQVNQVAGQAGEQISNLLNRFGGFNLSGFTTNENPK